MALVTLTDAAKLVRKARTTLMRDIENGRLTKTVLQDGDVRIDTTELVRAYGRLHSPQAAPKPRESGRTSADKTRIALLEERIRSLERVIVLEAELRRVKDQVTTELRARLADKDHLIKILENKILFLEYDRQTQQTRQVPTLEPEQPASDTSVHRAAPATPATPVATAASAAAEAPASPVAPAGAAATMPPAGQTAAASMHASPDVPGGKERRRPPSGPRGWWRRIFGGKPRNH